MKIHTIPLHIGDLTQDTYHLSALEFGAYIRLLIQHYQMPDGIPESMLQRYSGVPNRNWASVKQVLKPYFSQSKNGLWKQKRVLETLDSIHSKSTLNKRKALKRWNSDDAGASSGQCKGNAESMQSKSQKPKAINQEDTINSISIAFDLWNNLASEIDLPKAQSLNQTRKSKMKSRLSECGGVDGWNAALEKVKSSPFLRGEKTDFKATLDFLLQPSSFTKLMEGNYDDKPKTDRTYDELQRYMEQG